MAFVGGPTALATAPAMVNKMTSGQNVSRVELEEKVMSVDKDTIECGTSHA